MRDKAAWVKNNAEAATVDGGRWGAERGLHMTNPGIAVGPEVIRFVIEQFQVEDIWSVKESRKLIWWPFRLAVTVWADPMQLDVGHAVCKIHARTDVLKNVPPAEKTYAILAMLNACAILSRYVYDPTSMKVSLECSAYIHNGTESWLKPHFATAVSIQVAQAHAELDHLVEMSGAQADESLAPVGVRTIPDAMLHILHLFKEKGDAPSHFLGAECENVRKMRPELCDIVMANSDKKGATVEFPFPGCVPSSTMLRIHADESHPKIGNGALLVLKIPAIPGVKQDYQLANHLNLLEMQQWSRTRSFGAWCPDAQAANSEEAIAYVSFIPSAARRNGLLQNEVMMMAARSRWLHDFLKVSSKGHMKGLRF
jgi:hypothetical protein